ncbi:sensor histidine kinase [Sulfuricella sp.]|uniref:sensor histidine kinase n=1 Tax=Sulfuricella sp. TaxID=2099377 RepID=UPI002BE1342E|nr:PhnD/SsuA/transferrin family substrate-binding protein [Sulfuricella sp.]HUX64593.1 PhnD/SsuA/transferrin family substrate-binding protein [Sulfuricella sp.]
MLFLRPLYRLGVFLMGVALLLQASLADASNATTVRIGVLAYKGAEAVQEDWSYVRNWLVATIPDHRFILLDFDQAGLTRAVHERTIDFVITNSGHYVALEHSDGASRIATIESPWALSPRQSIGSAIVVRNGAHLHTLADLAGKHVLAVDPDAFGGYQIAARELLEAGVDPAHDLADLQFTGFPIQKIVHAVHAGRADAGIIRTCLLEQMIRSGEIGAGELRVLAPIATQGFQCQTSSRLYPDWPIAALRHTPAELSKQVAIALLAMPRTADGYSWAVPADYQVVDELFRELKIGPYAYLRQWTFEGVLRRYWGWMLLILALLVVWAVHTVRVEHLVSQRTRALRDAQEEQRRMAEEARLRQTTLDHTARLAILGEMASAIAHELNQPLAAIRNFARGMARRITAGRLEPAPLLDGTNEIVTQSERAASIIRNIRAFAQKRASEQKSVDLIAVLGEAIALFTGTHPQARVIWQPDATQPAKVMADPVKIQQVMLNLLKNALDAQQTAGHAQEPIEVRFRVEASAYLITVRDSGCGLKPEQFARLFEPFFTTKPEGLGLGLSLSKSIIESLGGTLSAMANDDNPGLAVWFSLPREESQGGL